MQRRTFATEDENSSTQRETCAISDKQHLPWTKNQPNQAAHKFKDDGNMEALETVGLDTNIQCTHIPGATSCNHDRVIPNGPYEDPQDQFRADLENRIGLMFRKVLVLSWRPVGFPGRRRGKSTLATFYYDRAWKIIRLSDGGRRISEHIQNRLGEDSWYRPDRLSSGYTRDDLAAWDIVGAAPRVVHGTALETESDDSMNYADWHKHKKEEDLDFSAAMAQRSKI